MTIATPPGLATLSGRLSLGRPSIAGLMVSAFILLGIAAPFVAPYDPTHQNLRGTLLGPSPAHLLGTDHLGRDEFSRVLVAGRTSLIAVSAVAAIALTVGMTLGVVAGYLGGVIDLLIMRVVDLFIGLPSLVLGLALVGLVGPSLVTLVLALGVTWWPQYARLVRAQVLVTRRLGYIEALEVAGASPFRILTRHLVPATIGPAIVLLSTDAGNILLSVAGFSFLGLGVQPPTPEWGQMLVEARPYLQSSPGLMIWPGVAILLVVLSFNLLGNSLSLRFDPATRDSA